MKTFFVFVALFLLTAPAFAAEVPACQCMERPFGQRLEEATAVFAGTVEKIEDTDAFDRQPKADPPAIVTLKVEEAYKGMKGRKTFMLHTSLPRHTCTGHPFEVGKTYLVFAYLRQDFSNNFTNLYSYPLGTYDVGGLCGGTKLFEKAGEDLVHLKPEKAGKIMKFFNK